MFPESLCIVLSQLHSDAPCHSWRYTQKQVETSLGLPKGTLFQVFDDFDTKPLASGSIAQVHRASLNGTSVIAKVRHPNVSKLIDMDFRLMRMVATIADFLPALSWLHVRETVEQFSHTMAAQSHLGVEAHHLEVLNHNFRKWDHVSFPQPLFATSAVILETFEPGRLVTTVLDDYNAVASQIRLQKMSSLSEGNNNEGESYQTSYPQGYQLIPPELAKFIVTTGLSLYLKMLLIGKHSLQIHLYTYQTNRILRKIDKCMLTCTLGTFYWIWLTSKTRRSIRQLLLKCS
jgi:aarF domain-containing kinase